MIGESKVTADHDSQKLRHFLISFIVSFIVVGMLVGNAYMQSNVGYPSFLEPVGIALVLVGFAVAIPPWLLLWGLRNLGIIWELRGRESFIESNLWLWVYCVAFYTLAIYCFLWAKRWRTQKGERARRIQEQHGT